MRYALSVAALCLLSAAAAKAHPAPPAPARPAFDLAQTPGADCRKAGLWHHAAYSPHQPDASVRCSHPLSTDTLVSVHRWDKT